MITVFPFRIQNFKLFPNCTYSNLFFNKYAQNGGYSITLWFHTFLFRYLKDTWWRNAGKWFIEKSTNCYCCCCCPNLLKPKQLNEWNETQYLYFATEIINMFIFLHEILFCHNATLNNSWCIFLTIYNGILYIMYCCKNVCILYQVYNTQTTVLCVCMKISLKFL